MSTTAPNSPAPKKEPWWANLKLWLIGAGAVIGSLLLMLLTGKQSTPRKNFISTAPSSQTVVTDQAEVVSLPKTQAEGQLTSAKTAAVDTSQGSTLTGEEVQSEAQVTGTAAPGASAGDALFGPRK